MEKGLYEKIKEGNTIHITGGEFTILSLMEALGQPLTEEDRERYKQLELEQKKRIEKEKQEFLEKWGENTVKLHKFLSEKLSNPFTTDKNHKEWAVKRVYDDYFSDNIYLEWTDGYYRLVFSGQDGYGKRVVLRDGLTEEYIYEYIESWK